MFNRHEQLVHKDRQIAELRVGRLIDFIIVIISIIVAVAIQPAGLADWTT